MGEKGFERKFFERKIGETRKEEREELKKEREPEDDTKGVFLDEITKGIEEKNTEYDKRWFAEHQRKIRDAGRDPESRDEGYIKMVAGELGADNDLMKKWKYRSTKREITGLIAVREGVGEETEKGKFTPKEFTDIDDWYLMLNTLNKRAEKYREEFTDLKGKSEKGEELTEKEKERKKELEELEEARLDLGQKITGKNLEEEVTEKAESIKEDIIKREFSDRFREREDYLRELGYRVREEWAQIQQPFQPQVVRRELVAIHLSDSGGRPIDSFRTEEDLNKFLKEKTFEKIKPELEKEWEETGREGKVRKNLVEKEIYAIGDTPEKAKGGIKTVYGRKMEEVATEAKMAKVMPKTAEGERELKETFGEKEIDIVTLGQEVLNEKMVKKIKENPEKAIGKFCKKKELPFDSKDFGEYSKKITEMGWPREELIKNEEGILALFFGFLYYLILGEQKREERLGEFFEGLKPKIE